MTIFSKSTVRRTSATAWHAGRPVIACASSRAPRSRIKRRRGKKIARAQLQAGPHRQGRAVPYPALVLAVLVARHVQQRRHVPDYDVRIGDRLVVCLALDLLEEQLVRSRSRHPEIMTGKAFEGI